MALLASPARVQSIVFHAPAGLFLAMWRQLLSVITRALRSAREGRGKGPRGLLSESTRVVYGMGPRHAALKAFPRRAAGRLENSFEIDFKAELEPHLGAVLGEGVSAVVYKVETPPSGCCCCC